MISLAPPRIFYGINTLPRALLWTAGGEKPGLLLRDATSAEWA